MWLDTKKLEDTGGKGRWCAYAFWDGSKMQRSQERESVQILLAMYIIEQSNAF
jgi:hypothetical protein